MRNRRVLLPGLALLLLLPGCSAAIGAAAEPVEPPEEGDMAEGVTVDGVGRVTGVPDVLRATIGVEVRRPAVQEALDAANAGAERVLAALRDAGVEERDVHTRDLAVYPEYHSPAPDAPPEISGYVVVNLVEAKLRELDRVGELLDAVLRAGGDDARLNGVAFALEDNAELLEAARDAAFADARAKAEQYARLAGGSLGPLVRLVEADAATPMAHEYETDDAMAAARQDVPIAPGEQEVQVRATATWRLE